MHVKVCMTGYMHPSTKTLKSCEKMVEKAESRALTRMVMNLH